MSHNVTIQEGALFIADAHDCTQRAFFLSFLHDIAKNPPPQLFLMGDMFDLLIGDVRYGLHKYAHYITLLERIAQTCEVYYFEGNHDFNLKNYFSHVRVIGIKEQPILGLLPTGKTVLLSHGDKYGDFIHRTYTSIIRNPLVLKVLNAIDITFNYAISKKIESNQQKKALCRTISAFETLISKKLPLYPNADVIAEGHYHQNRSFHISNTFYINFSSFACNQSYFCVQSSLETPFAPMQYRSCPTK